MAFEHSFTLIGGLSCYIGDVRCQFTSDAVLPFCSMPCGPSSRVFLTPEVLSMPFRAQVIQAFCTPKTASDSLLERHALCPMNVLRVYRQKSSVFGRTILAGHISQARISWPSADPYLTTGIWCLSQHSIYNSFSLSAASCWLNN